MFLNVSMKSLKYYIFVSFATLLLLINECTSQNATCISMNLEKHSRENFAVLPNSISCIKVKDIFPTKCKFFVIEVHSQKLNITLSETESPSRNNSITGTAVGLVSVISELRTSTYWITNNNKISIDVSVKLVPYLNEAPIPGGCNMEFPVEISPFLRLHHKSGYTVLEFQHSFIDYSPTEEPPNCAISLSYISYNFYVYYLEEMNYDQQEYFRGISLMQDVDSVKKHGKLVKPYPSPRTRVKFSLYPGQGIIYNVVARYSRNGTWFESAYVPYATYGCSFTSEVDGCGHLTGPLAKFLVLGMAVLGLFIAIKGHRFLTIEMGYFGFLASALVCFVLLVRFGEYSNGDRDIFTLLGAFAGAVIWAGIWWFFGIPVISVLLVAFVLGFLLTSVVFFTPIGNVELLRNDFNYWMLLTCGILVAPVVLLAATKFLNIAACAIVGSYAIVIAVDRYIGTSLSYIVLNVVKRAVVDDFYLTFNEVPFQRNDIILSSTWVALSVGMIALQFYLEKGRAPFPPAPALERRRGSETRRERLVARRQNSGRTVHFLDSTNERTRLLPSNIDSANERTPLLASNVATVYSRVA